MKKKKYIGLPTKYYIDEYSMMEEFIETIEDVRLYNQLQIAINGLGAFREGNTRTTALFIEKYLISLGYEVDNTLFKEKSVYFEMH